MLKLLISLKTKIELKRLLAAFLIRQAVSRLSVFYQDAEFYC